MGKIKPFERSKNQIKERWNLISRRVLRCLLTAQLTALAIYASYLVYEIATGSFIVFKSILLAATVAYAIFYTIEHDKLDKPSRAKKKIGKRVYTLTKIAVKGCTLALTFFGIFAATVSATLWSVTLAVLMLFGWIISLAFEILSWLVDRKVKKIKEQAAKEAQAARESARKKYTDTKKRATDTYNNAKSRVSKRVKDTKDGIKKTADTVKGKMRGGAKRVGAIFSRKKDAKDGIMPPDTESAGIPVAGAAEEE